MNQVLMLCGSLRRQSWNRALLNELAQRWPGLAGSQPWTIDRLDVRDVDLPLQNADLEDDFFLMDRVLSLHHRLTQAQMLVIASPEHNGQVSAALKNLIDWVSRVAYLDPQAPNPFHGKPTLLVSATPGWSGGVLGLHSLRALMAYVGGLVLADTICVPRIVQHDSAEGLTLPADLSAQIDDTLIRLMKLRS
jgi:NAD(P)H-dependent FMN reductase